MQASISPPGRVARNCMCAVVVIPYLVPRGRTAIALSPCDCQPHILSAWETKGNRSGKTFLIIVNKSTLRSAAKPPQSNCGGAIGGRLRAQFVQNLLACGLSIQFITFSAANRRIIPSTCERSSGPLTTRRGRRGKMRLCGLLFTPFWSFPGQTPAPYRGDKKAPGRP